MIYLWQALWYALETPQPNFLLDTLLPSVASGIVVAAIVAGIFGISQAVIARKSRQDRTPADENEATRLGNEFFKTLLGEAREERKELRETIRQLETDGTTKQSRIDALLALDARKTRRIDILEMRARLAAEKLASGSLLTIVDILGGTDEDILGTASMDEGNTASDVI